MLNAMQATPGHSRIMPARSGPWKGPLWPFFHGHLQSRHSMVALKHSEMRIIDDALAMGGGYVLDFSDRTFAEFFDDEFKVIIYSEKYGFNGGSKAKHIGPSSRRLLVSVRTDAGAPRAIWSVRSLRFGTGLDHFSPGED